MTEVVVENHTLKLIDFGMARPCLPGTTLRTKLGSPYFIAPEVLTGRYDAMCDVWSIGVIMYILLSGHLPFSGSTDAETFSRVRRVGVSFTAEAWIDVSQEAKDLVKSLLTYSSPARIMTDEALKHNWIVPSSIV